MSTPLENHRHFPPGIQEHDEEELPGLPAPLPAGETILWQGQPSWKEVAVRIIHLRAIAVYFLILFCWGALVSWDETASVGATALASIKTLPFILMGFACFLYLAKATAKHTVYTITNKRVVMRIGIALTITYNIPFKRIAGANVLRRADGSGEISLNLAKGEKIAYLMLYPHARPWQLLNPQPMLRCLSDVEGVSKIFTAAWTKAQEGEYIVGEASRTKSEQNERGPLGSNAQPA